jgi:hypothetical protein
MTSEIQVNGRCFNGVSQTFDEWVLISRNLILSAALADVIDIQSPLILYTPEMVKQWPEASG